jgi:hypothetical protein
MSRIDMLYEGGRDFYSVYSSYGFVGWDSVLENARNNPKANARYLPIFNHVSTKRCFRLEI